MSTYLFYVRENKLTDRMASSNYLVMPEPPAKPLDPLFRPIKLERVAEKVANQLKQVIGDSVFKVGDKLPSERELAELMGVSRPSIREALQLLEVQGIIQTVHGGGSVVRNLTAQAIRPPIEMFLEQDGRRVLELAEVRACMEAWAARQAAANRTEAEVQALRGFVAEMEQDFESGEIGFEVDLKFHTQIAAATHNTIYLHLMDNIYELLQFSIRVHREEQFVTREAQEAILRHHQNIFLAVERGDPDAAETAMKEHLLFVIRDLKKLFPS
ncbi:MAG: FadR/GntR family transcriptional regulator [Deltaproteobacteria bacterium]|nr:FadR/GntR family transcriptional regulator [Deltaproteobacteria bacterium]